jgi:hypothetical protein
VGATREAGEPLHGDASFAAGKTIWYKFTPRQAGLLKVRERVVVVVAVVVVVVFIEGIPSSGLSGTWCLGWGLSSFVSSTGVLSVPTAARSPADLYRGQLVRYGADGVHGGQLQLPAGPCC